MNEGCLNCEHPLTSHAYAPNIMAHWCVEFGCDCKVSDTMMKAFKSAPPPHLKLTKKVVGQTCGVCHHSSKDHVSSFSKASGGSWHCLVVGCACGPVSTAMVIAGPKSYPSKPSLKPVEKPVRGTITTEEPDLPPARYPGWVTGLATETGWPGIAQFTENKATCLDCEEDPCTCEKCGYCKENDADCNNCWKSCKECCSCLHCEGCGGDYPGYDFCDDCEKCEECCECVGEECPKCGSSYAPKCEGCANCTECCFGCGSMTKDIGWKFEPDRKPVDKDYYAEFDPVQGMADFYLLSYMETQPPAAPYAVDYVDAMQAITSEAAKAKSQLVAELDQPFQQYLDIAIGGELRHHPAIGIKVLPASRRDAWAVWPSIREQVGPQALLDAAMLFEEFTNAGYGGEPWAAAARILHQRVTGKIPPWIFVDRVFTMQHHNGSILNKVFWGQKGIVNGNVELCLMVGEAHSDDETDLATLLLFASPPTRELFGRWWTLRNRALVSSGKRPEAPPSYIDHMVQEKFRYWGPTEWQYRIPGTSQRIRLIQEGRIMRLATLAKEIDAWKRGTTYNPDKPEPVEDEFMRYKPAPQPWAEKPVEGCECEYCAILTKKAQASQAKAEAAEMKAAGMMTSAEAMLKAYYTPIMDADLYDEDFGDDLF